MRIGIDVGGTNTDAVLMDERRVLAEVKTPTTPDVTSGIVAALRTLIADSGVEAADVQGVMIGTTHFTNAVVEAKRLMPTACIRLGLPATQALPPMVDWPNRLRQALGDHHFLVHGGHEFDGREISPLDPDELRRVAGEIGARGIRSVAISSVFSPVNTEFEQRAAEIVTGELPEAAISLSHEIGRIGLLERENATIMNACLRVLAVHIVEAFHTALAEFGIEAAVYLSQNDGTLMSVDFAERYPVATFASGPTNSMRGAAFLSGILDCAVVDIGGTTSDVGVLHHGFPREASIAVEIGGVRTNFRMPDVFSFGLGGGSLVRDNGELTIGPDSVGYELTERALVVGGGSILLGERLAGASEVVKPEHFAVANAIGAAIAQIGGEVDRVFSLESMPREEALQQAKDEATEKAVAAGASAGTVHIVDVEEVPLAYLPSNATRIHVKAVGELELKGMDVAPRR